MYPAFAPSPHPQTPLDAPYSPHPFLPAPTQLPARSPLGQKGHLLTSLTFTPTRPPSGGVRWAVSACPPWWLGDCPGPSRAELPILLSAASRPSRDSPCQACGGECRSMGVREGHTVTVVAEPAGGQVEVWSQREKRTGEPRELGTKQTSGWVLTRPRFLSPAAWTVSVRALLQSRCVTNGPKELSGPQQWSFLSWWQTRIGCQLAPPPLPDSSGGVQAASIPSFPFPADGPSVPWSRF